VNCCHLIAAHLAEFLLTSMKRCLVMCVLCTFTAVDVCGLLLLVSCPLVSTKITSLIQFSKRFLYNLDGAWQDFITAVTFLPYTVSLCGTS